VFSVREEKNFMAFLYEVHTSPVFLSRHHTHFHLSTILNRMTSRQSLGHQLSHSVLDIG